MDSTVLEMLEGLTTDQLKTIEARIVSYYRNNIVEKIQSVGYRGLLDVSNTIKNEMSKYVCPYKTEEDSEYGEDIEEELEMPKKPKDEISLDGAEDSSSDDDGEVDGKEGGSGTTSKAVPVTEKAVPEGMFGGITAEKKPVKNQKELS